MTSNNTPKQIEHEHLLNCLARKINSMNRTKQKSFGKLLHDKQTPEFIADIKRRMKNESVS